MGAWRICLVVLAAVCVSCEGGPSLHKESLPGEKIGELRKLLMTTVAGGSDWVPITDAEMNADGSDHGQAGDGTVARFKTDASGSWKGRIGGDGSVTEGEGNASGPSSVTSGGSMATVETKDDGKSPVATLQASDLGELGTSHMTIVDHAPTGMNSWLGDALRRVTQSPPIVSENPPIGKTPSQVLQGIGSGNGVSSPDTYYSRNRQAVLNAGGTDLPEPTNGFASTPKPLLTRWGTAQGEAATAALN